MKPQLNKLGLTEVQMDIFTNLCAKIPIEFAHLISRNATNFIGFNKDTVASIIVLRGFSWGYTTEGNEYWESMFHALESEEDFVRQQNEICCSLL